MRNLTSCICILGLSGTAFGVVMMDQIGPDDGTGIGTGITGCQNFEAAYDIYDIATLDNFTGAGETINQVEMVLNGWNGFVDPSSVMGYTANLHSAPAAAATSLVGDVGTSYADAATATISGTWVGAGFVVSMPTTMTAAVGDNWVSMVPDNDFATGGQTGVADSFLGDGVLGWQANPGGGFGMPGNMAEMTGEAAYRVSNAGAADPCSLPLPQPCPSDIDADGSVAVSDILAVIGSWGEVGDGTFRPLGDVAPLPNGDCAVTVGDVLAVVGSFGADCNVYGACCYDDGTCADGSTAANCAAAGGTFLGDNSLCADGGCVAGACCIDTMTCSDLTGAACTALGGSYEGDGTACATTDCAAVTPGDECVDAIAAVDGATPFDTTGMTPSTPEPDEAQCTGTFLSWTGSQDIWFSYVATGGLTMFDTCDTASYDTSLVLYEGTCATQVACNGDAVSSTGCQPYHSEIIYDCVAGTTYFVRIGGYNADFGAGTLNITPPATGTGACCMTDGSCLDGMAAADCAAFGGTFGGDLTTCADPGMCSAPAGDECSSASIAIEGPNPFDTTAMTPSPEIVDEAMCAGTYLNWLSSPDSWMVYTPAADGTVTFSACDAASYDTSMVIYEGVDCASMIQVACNGDTSGETGCQSWYSAVYDHPVVGGMNYWIRMGGYNAAVGPGTVTITYTAPGALGSCCAGGGCVENTLPDCDLLGGVWFNGGACATTTCYLGCPAGAELECDACALDGDDSSLDCNAGLNGPTGTEFQAITIGVPICGTGSVFIDGPTGGTYRDLDWFTNATLDLGGDFTISVGSSGMDLLFGVVDNTLGAFVAAYVLPGGTEGSADFLALPAGNYSILVGASDWNTAWTCASGLVDYWVRLD